MSSRVSAFALSGIKKYWELTPLVSILSAACMGAGAFTFYALATKSDVRVNKSSDLPPWERVNRETPQKLMTFNIKYSREHPDIEKLREEIGSYKC